MTESDSVTRVFAWCLPRTCSTTLMYAWGSRSDTECIDEPMYAHYLRTNSSVYRSYRTQVLAAQENDGNTVITNLLQCPVKGRVLFAKMMSKHADGLDLDPLLKSENCFHILLFREPIRVLSSYAKAQEANTVGRITLDETGYPSLVRIASRLRELGRPFLTIDGDKLASEPRLYLSRMCEFAKGIPFDEAMLQWEAGPKQYDGVWANKWYSKLHASTGWVSSPPPEGASSSVTQFPSSLFELLNEVFPFYQVLALRQTLVRNEDTTITQWPKSPCVENLNDPNALALMPGGGEADFDNRNILVWIGPPGRGRLVPREFARISVFDSAVQGGDAVWEGIRIYNNRVFMLEAHLQRLFDSAKILGFRNVHSKSQVIEALFTTLIANGMNDQAHVRLTLTRGLKVTSSMNPDFNLFGTTLIVLAEHKPVLSAATYDNNKGVRLISSSVRRNSPQTLDSKIHHNNLLNNILAKLQANNAGAADAIMLDHEGGYVSETNATNIFLVRDNEIHTPHADHCLPGVTRSIVIDYLTKSVKTVCHVRRISIAEFYVADEVFTTGTLGELTPIINIDGRSIGDGTPGPFVVKLQAAFQNLISTRKDLSVPLTLATS
uniref:Branched-chain-amino-acid transaminase n=1 Tax=Aureoumbra lagunensis TaxID=44058 RepID=A0A7S3JZ18_9STRA|mmetsp:Transcript_13823/g.20695  ORF Transcript_13823/g.20695 Transcript_13823/m.20695 type:complete len:607 (+) Transcript_13823:48-1868(+)